MGDGILDYLVMEKVFYSISPANGHEFAKKSARLHYKVVVVVKEQWQKQAFI
jgi:3-deoxy-D-manno-octulosonate 8-phosphate phosphatase KdsC-like HAD superfamily phosphatase